MKTLDLRKTVAELVKEYPEVKEIMASLGFKEIVSPLALSLMGKVMTIPKGASVKGISMESVLTAFISAGFEVVGYDDANKEEKDPNDRLELLKHLLKRLGDGEDIESVRKDFVAYFKTVSVQEIAQAEQELIDEGTPLNKVQSLCDLHSALFHGKTEAEIWEEEQKGKEDGKKIPEGHPLYTLRLENAALEKLLDNAFLSIENKDKKQLISDLQKLKGIKTLYSKKESIIMPILYRHGITGPSDVMWGVDDEIKAGIGKFSSILNETNYDAHIEEVKAILSRMKEMIYKEEKILFPLCLENFSQEEWEGVYKDLPDLGYVFISSAPSWKMMDEKIASESKGNIPSELENGLVHFPLGELNVKQIQAIFDVLPMDLTFIDENAINRFYTNHGKVFSRPSSTLGKLAYDCHPASVKPVVESLLKDFKEGKRDSMEVWTPNPARPILVRYFAIRDKEGKYLGALEVVEDMSFVREKILSEK